MSPNSLLFGNQRVGFPTLAQKVMLKNNGSGPVQVTSVFTTNGAYTVTPAGPFTLAAQGGERELSVVFSPSAKGAASGELKVTTDETTATANVVTLSGNGVSMLELNPSSEVDFGVVPRNTNLMRTVLVKNLSTAPIQVVSVSIPGGTPFSIGAKPQSIASLSTGTIEVNFNPVNGGATSAEMTVETDALDSPHVLMLKGTGAVPQAHLSIPGGSGNAITELDFGGVQKNTTKTLLVRLRNIGTAPLDVFNPQLTAGAFSVSGLNATTLQPQTFIDFQVSFLPTVVGAAGATLTIPTNALTNTVLTLTGVGASPELKVDRASIFFGDARVGSSDNKVPVTVTNTGNAPVNVQSLPVDGPVRHRARHLAALPGPHRAELHLRGHLPALGTRDRHGLRHHHQ